MLGVSAKLEISRGWTGAVTDNAPSEKRASNPIFSRRPSCRCSTSRIGKNRMIASVRILMTAKAIQKEALLVHVASISLFHEALIGIHCRMVANTEPIVKAATMPRLM